RVLETYLPQQMPREEIERITREKMAGLNIATKENAGTLMKALMAELKGRADGAVVKGVVDALLA
ncbi:MAG: GatB/YqeY domain-containing protein, partial [Patescibacteria group bacterium]|nr:GatB/YqeY domain-containing protein [Patescibacteria group bacterium]